MFEPVCKVAKARLGGQRGIAFIGALMLVGVLISLVAAVGSLSHGEALATPYWANKNEAFYVAQSGIEHALWKLSYAKDSFMIDGVTEAGFSSDSEPESIGVLPEGSWYDVYVTQVLDSPDYPFEYLVESTGHTGNQIHKLAVRALQQEGDGPLGEGDDTVDLGDGDAYVPSIPNFGDLHLDGNDIYDVGGVDENGNPRPTALLFDSITMTGSSRIIVHGPVTIYILDHISAEGDTEVNPIPEGADSPTYDLTFFIPPLYEEDGAPVDQWASLRGNAIFNAFLYAPTADVRATGSTEIYGDIEAMEVKVNGSTNYDPGAETVPWPASFNTEFDILEWIG